MKIIINDVGNWKDFNKFYNENSIIKKLYIIKSILNLPAYFYHELWHILFCLLTFTKMNNITLHNFYIVKNNALRACHMSINIVTYTDSFKSIMGGILVILAPLFGIIVLLIISKWFIIWIIFSFKIFILSKADVKMFKLHIGFLMTLKNKK